MLKLRTYQQDAFKWSRPLMHFGYIISMRLGKCILTIRSIRSKNIKLPTLVICPSSAIQGWIDDLREEKTASIIEITGSRKRREELLNEFFDSDESDIWFIANKEIYRVLPEISDLPWGSVVIDESRILANPRSGQSKFYVENFRDAQCRIILTGTADYRNKLDYFQQLRFLNHKALPYKNYWDFRNRAFFQIGNEFVMKKSHSEILKRTLGRCMFFVKKEDVDGGRTKDTFIHYVKLPRKIQKIYTTAEEEFVLENGDSVVKSMFATQAFIWLMRLCGGCDENHKFIHTVKLNKLTEILARKMMDSNAVIICRFKYEVYALQKTLSDILSIPVMAYTGDLKEKNRRRIRKFFMYQKSAILIAHPNSLSHGTDLSSARMLVFYSQPNGKEIKDQVADRIFTMKDTKHNEIHEIIVKDTVDEDTLHTHEENLSLRTIFEKAASRCRIKN